MPKKKPATPTVLPAEPPAKMGRPSKYQPRFCQLLVEHCRQGGSFESFAPTAGVAISTLYEWLTDHADFSEARKAGQGYLHKFYEELGRMLATGQLRRLKSEEPVLDAKGKPILDPKTGQVLMKREYEPVQGNSTAWIFLTKNMIGWSDKRALAIAMDHTGEVRVRADTLTPEERMKEIAEMTKALAEIEQNASSESA